MDRPDEKTRPSNVVSAEALPWDTQERGTRYGWRRRQLGQAAGGVKLGCSMMELPPGRRSFPQHYHLANEEALYVLEGEGTLRLGKEEVPVREGDYVALPAGERHAHQLVNTSGAPLRYLAFSTMEAPDIAVYPESGKVGLFAGAAPGGPKAARTLHTYLRQDATVDYWEGEDAG